MHHTVDRHFKFKQVSTSVYVHVEIPHRRVSMLPDVHLGKGASVSYPDDLYSEVSEEINDLQRLPPQTEDEDDGSHHWTQQLL